MALYYSLRRLRVVFFLWVLVSCEAAHGPEDKKQVILGEAPKDNCLIRVQDQWNEKQDEFTKKVWISKAARLLKMNPEVDLARKDSLLLTQTRPEIIQNFMNRTSFGDFVLDFNRYFLGLKPDRLKNNQNNYIDDIYSLSSTIKSAQETVKCGNYEALFDWQQEYYLPPLSSPQNRNPAELKNEDQLRKEIVEDIYDGWDQQIQRVNTLSMNEKEKFCTDFQDFVHKGFGNFISLGISASVIFDVVFSHMITPVFTWCDDSQSTLNVLKEIFEKGKMNIHHFLKTSLEYTLEKYAPRSVSEIKSVHWDLSPPLFTHSFSGLKELLLNSSTNYNRKRAAFVLSRYFCDDLTPINVEDSGSHISGKHGSDPACQSCHHRLDPMAGFFKNWGIQFRSFSQKEKITFDDGVRMDRDKYQEAWRMPQGSQREWNIGFIRSQTESERNSYGESLEDLFQIIQTAPEVKKCLVRKVFSYLVAEKQAVDSGYMEQLTEQYIQTSHYNSSLAFKELVAAILLSHSFSQHNLDPEECYDYPFGHQQKNNPPCRVNYLLQKNCVRCHQINNRSGGLDLSQWVEDTEQKGKYNFLHLDGNGKRWPLRITLNRMIERLNSRDSDLRMPLKQFIEPGEREALFLWANSYLP